MPEFVLDHGSAAGLNQFLKVDAFTRGYVECAFFTSTGNAEDEGLATATTAELAPETWARIIDDCTRFQAVNRILLVRAYSRLDYREEKAGRDFWYTRNGHGCGFWDRCELEAGDLGDKLTAACKTWGSVDLYRGDDGKIYLS